MVTVTQNVDDTTRPIQDYFFSSYKYALYRHIRCNTDIVGVLEAYGTTALYHQYMYLDAPRLCSWHNSILLN